MYNLSILVNERMAVGFVDKLLICNELMINNLEIDGRIDGKLLWELSGEEIEATRNALIDYNKKIVLFNISESVSELEVYKKVFRNAHLLNVEAVKIDMEGQMEEHLDIACLKSIVKIGKSYGIKVLFENNSKSFFSNDKNITEIFKSLGADGMGLIFNPAEFVRLKLHPFFQVFYKSKMKQNVSMLRVNDALFIDGKPVLPCEGNAELKEMVSLLLAQSFKGYFSFVPYFNDTDIETYARIITLFKSILKKL